MTVLSTVRSALVDGRSVMLKNIGTLEPRVVKSRRFQVPGGNVFHAPYARVKLTTSQNLRAEIGRGLERR
jgi:nucleoid DNA-binding protein